MTRCIIFTFLAASRLAGFAQVDLAKGLIACYTFAGNANDSSGNDNHAVVHGATLASGRSGDSNSAYFFDGINDYIELPPAAFRNDAFTYSVWISPQMPQRRVASAIISIGDSIDARSNGMQLDLPADPAILTVSFSTTSAVAGLPVTGRGGELQDAKVWRHLVCTRSGRSIELYVDGQKWAPGFPTFASAEAPYYGNHTAARLGVHCKYIDTEFMKPYLGRIDDVAIYNRALSEDEVKALYKAGHVCVYRPPPIPPPFAADVNVCLGDTAFVAAAGGIDYTWYDDEDRVLFSGNPLILPGVSESATYFVSNVTEKGESAKVAARVIVHHPPAIDCEFPPSSLPGEPEVYKVNVSGGTAPYDITFSFEGDTVSGDDSARVHAYAVPGNFQTTVSVSDIHGCRSACSGATAVYEPFVPNVITANGDSLNNAFTLYLNIHGRYHPYDGPKPFLLAVFNRWGSAVFTSSDPKRPWNPSDVAPGLFAYQIALGSRKYKGFVQVHR